MITAEPPRLPSPAPVGLNWQVWAIKRPSRPAKSTDSSSLMSEQPTRIYFGFSKEQGAAGFWTLERWWPGADKSAGSRCGARSDPNEVRARTMDGPQPINHRHADFQSNPPTQAYPCTPFRCGLIFSDSNRPSDAARKGWIVHKLRPMWWPGADKSAGSRFGARQIGRTADLDTRA